MPSDMNILVVEDDREIVEVLDSRLSREGFRVRKAYDGKAGYDAAQAETPSLILLDLMLPKIRGLEVCKQIRENSATKNIPIIMLTANADEVDVVLGLEMGADDYVTKPFNLRQLVARIHAVLRRTNAEAVKEMPVKVSLGPIEIDHKGHEVRVNKKVVTLTESEYEILYILASRAGQVVMRGELLEMLSKEDSTLVERNVDVHIGNLRKKLGSFGRVIVTVRSHGYKCMNPNQLSA